MRRQRPYKKRLVLGLTGSFGSGKTTVAKYFRTYGARIVDAYRIAHAVLGPGKPAYKKIVRIFGERILKKNKSIDRKRLAKIVFRNNNLLHKLNCVVHPEVIKAIKARISALESGIIVLDAPLLIEAGLNKIVDKLIVVSIDRKEQLARLEKKLYLGKRDILERIKAQIPLSDKVRMADFVIDNSLRLEETRKQVIKIRRLLWKN